MQQDIDDLGYNPSSLLGPLDVRRVEKFQQYLHDCDQPIVFDPSYLRHLAKFHGGVPKKRCFKTVKGNEHVIERFLNFIDKQTDEGEGWYNVGVTWTLIEDRLNDYLMPFAALFGGECLCFDYEKDDRPQIVVWLHADSRQDRPVTEYVAANFDEFLTKLYEPSP